MSTVTPRAAYDAAIRPNSSDGPRITEDEIGKIRDAFNQRTYWVDVGGFRRFESTEHKQNAFLRELAAENPALALTLIRGGDWDMYRQLRNQQVGDSFETSRARASVLRHVEGKSPQLTAADIPPALRQRIAELGARGHAAARANDASTIRDVYGFVAGEWQTPEGQQIEKELRDLGFERPRSVASEIIGRSR